MMSKSEQFVTEEERERIRRFREQPIESWRAAGTPYFDDGLTTIPPQLSEAEQHLEAGRERLLEHMRFMIHHAEQAEDWASRLPIDSETKKEVAVFAAAAQRAKGRLFPKRLVNEETAEVAGEGLMSEGPVEVRVIKTDHEFPAVDSIMGDEKYDHLGADWREIDYVERERGDR